MAPKYKLTYFPIEGKAEPMRWILSYGNIEFEDVRINLEDWMKIKPTTPFGQVPLLEIDGKVYWQNAAICRYLARELNLVGKTNLDALQADIIVDTIVDFRNQLRIYYHEKDPEKKKSLEATLLQETIPFFLARFDKIVKENNGYFVNGQLTWADIYFAAVMSYTQIGDSGDVFAKYSNLIDLKKKVEAFPQIQSWLERSAKSAKVNIATLLR